MITKYFIIRHWVIICILCISHISACALRHKACINGSSFKRYVHHTIDISEDENTETTPLIGKNYSTRQANSAQNRLPITPNGLTLTPKERSQLKTAAVMGGTGFAMGMLMAGPIGALIGVAIGGWGGAGVGGVAHDNQSNKRQQEALKKQD